MNQNDDRRPNPVRPDPPLFAPVVFGDDDDPPRSRGLRPPGGGGGDYESDSGLLRILGVIVVLGLVIIALVLPWSPLRVIGGGGDGDTVTWRARDEAPSVPEGLVALSKLYELTVPEGVTGPLSVEVDLLSPTTDGNNLAFYSWDGSAWARLAPVTLATDGSKVSGSIPANSVSLAVMRRTVMAGSLALIIESGATPDPRAVGSSSIVAVVAARPAPAAAAGELVAATEALAPALEASRSARVYFGVTDAGDPRPVQAVIASPELTATHIEAIVTEARAQGGAGVYLDYATLAAADRDRFTAFVQALAARTRAEGLGLVLAVPAPSSADTGAYDWAGLLGHADALWLRVPADPARVFETVEAGVRAQDEALLGRISLIIDRRSTELTNGNFGSITTRDALALASTIDRNNVQAIGPGGPVTLRAGALGEGGVLAWDDRARAVTFSAREATGDRTFWLTNHYSVAFRLDLAARLGLGGVAIEAGSNGDALPDVWGPVAEYLDQGVVTLLRPFGPYLVPCWQAEGGTLEGQGDCWVTETPPGTVVWRAPSEVGAYTVRLVVSDGVTFVAQEVAFRVGEDAPTPTPTATATPAPAQSPTPAPTQEPTPAPTQEATPEPTPTAPNGGPAGPAGND